MFELTYPFVLLLLPIPLAVHLLIPAYRQKDTAIRLPFFRNLAAAAGAELREGAVVLNKPRWAVWSASVMWALLIFALAEPVRLGQPVGLIKSKRDVVLAVDISGSMDTVDFPGPDGKNQQRLAAVRDVLRDFVARRDGDRIALIVFGSKAFVQTPLTADLQTVEELLNQTEVGMAGPHTALGDALGLAIRTFEASDIEQRVLIVLSDGNDTASRMSPINAAEIARDKGVEIFTIGVGDPDSSGENRLDLQVLKEIASRTGGQSFFAGDTDGLEQVYQRIDALTPRDEETMSWRPRESLSHWAILAAALIGVSTFLAAFLLKSIRLVS